MIFIGISSGISGGNIGQGMLSGGIGSLMSGAMNMNSVGSPFVKRFAVSTFSGMMSGGLSAGITGGDIEQGMRDGAIGGAVGFMTSWTSEYIRKTQISQKYAEEIMGIDAEYQKESADYGSDKINVTDNMSDPNKVLWGKLEAVYEKYGFPIDWLRGKDYDPGAILKFGKMHIRYGSDKMVNPLKYGRGIKEAAYQLNFENINVHYDKHDVIRYPVLHLIKDTYYQGRKGVH